MQPRFVTTVAIYTGHERHRIADQNIIILKQIFNRLLDEIEGLDQNGRAELLAQRELEHHILLELICSSTGTGTGIPGAIHETDGAVTTSVASMRLALEIQDEANRKGEVLACVLPFFKGLKFWTDHQSHKEGHKNLPPKTWAISSPALWYRLASYLRRCGLSRDQLEKAWHRF